MEEPIDGTRIDIRGDKSEGEEGRQGVSSCVRESGIFIYSPLSIIGRYGDVIYGKKITLAVCLVRALRYSSPSYGFPPPVRSMGRQGKVLFSALFFSLPLMVPPFTVSLSFVP